MRGPRARPGPTQCGLSRPLPVFRGGPLGPAGPESEPCQTHLSPAGPRVRCPAGAARRALGCAPRPPPRRRPARQRQEASAFWKWPHCDATCTPLQSLQHSPLHFADMVPGPTNPCDSTIVFLSAPLWCRVCPALPSPPGAWGPWRQSRKFGTEIGKTSALRPRTNKFRNAISYARTVAIGVQVWVPSISFRGTKSHELIAPAVSISSDPPP